MDTQNDENIIENSDYSPNYKNDDEVEIEVEYCYLTIPRKYICTYHKLLVALSDFGESAIKDCQSNCNTKSIYIIQCWNIFQSALACHTLGLDDKADFFIKYINAQLDNIYRGTDKRVYCGGEILPITSDGKLKARVSCTPTETKFYVDTETGNLYQTYIDNEEEVEPVYNIENNNLIVEK